jgi:hypothetical protein
MESQYLRVNLARAVRRLYVSIRTLNNSNNAFTTARKLANCNKKAGLY